MQLTLIKGDTMKFIIATIAAVGLVSSAVAAEPAKKDEKKVETKPVATAPAKKEEVKPAAAPAPAKKDEVKKDEKKEPAKK